MDGHALSSKEYKFLALTSDLLNAHLDKKLFQKYVDILDRSFISDVNKNCDQIGRTCSSIRNH